MIREDLQLKKPIKTISFISLPREDVYSGHPTGAAGVFAQKLNPDVSRKILDMVQAGITNVKEIKKSLKYCVDTFLCPNQFQVTGHFTHSMMTYIIILAKPKER